MIVNSICAKKIKDSRNEETIEVIVNECGASSPSGKSKGKYEVKPYFREIEKEVLYIKKLNVDKLSINNFKDLNKIEKYVKLGGNSLFALEASLLKALSKEKNLELWKFLGGSEFDIGSVGNTIGGGLHSKGINSKSRKIVK